MEALLINEYLHAISGDRPLKTILPEYANRARALADGHSFRLSRDTEIGQEVP